MSKEDLTRENKEALAGYGARFQEGIPDEQSLGVIEKGVPGEQSLGALERLSNALNRVSSTPRPSRPCPGLKESLQPYTSTPIDLGRVLLINQFISKND